MDNQEMTMDILAKTMEKAPLLRDWQLHPEAYVDWVLESHKKIAVAVEETWPSNNVVAGPGGQ